MSHVLAFVKSSSSSSSSQLSWPSAKSFQSDTAQKSMEEERNVPLNPKKGTRNKEQGASVPLQNQSRLLPPQDVRKDGQMVSSTGNSFLCRGLVRPRLSFDEQPLRKAPRCLQWTMFGDETFDETLSYPCQIHIVGLLSHVT